jgi:hypothetical protein
MIRNAKAFGVWSACSCNALYVITKLEMLPQPPSVDAKGLRAPRRVVARYLGEVLLISDSAGSLGFLSCGLEEVSGFASGQEVNILWGLTAGPPELFLAASQTYSSFLLERNGMR